MSDDIAYRSPHPLTILAVLLAILSPLALLSPILWVVPVLAVLVAIAALIKLAAGSEEKVGRKGALIAMAVALCFGTWGPARYVSRQQWLYRQARVYADAWLQLVQDQRLEEAHQLHLTSRERMADDVPLDEYYGGLPYVSSAFRDFFENEPLRHVVEMKKHAGRIEFDAYIGYKHRTHRDVVTLRYLLRLRIGNIENVLPLRVEMKRELDTDTGYRNWYVDTVF